ncbi:MAG: hydroxyacid dehydrogenase [Eudoraea sp.]|nr:hydroxyacid dehydrogenase [Eudoraea sp.]
MRILHLEENHPLLIRELDALGYTNVEKLEASYEEICDIIHEYDGLILRSRIPIDKNLLQKAKNLQFIGRVGSGLENIDVDLAKSQRIYLLAAPEGNRNAVAEHALGMLLSIMNKLHTADREVRQGQWRREANRGVELDGKVVGLIGYGNTGKAFAKKLSGFDVDVLCFDIIGGVGDGNARQVGMLEFCQLADVVSLHVPLTELTRGMVNTDFIEQFQKPFWFLNTARGKCVNTKDLVEGLRSGNILGAGLDVLEYEASSLLGLFNSGSRSKEIPEPLQYLREADNVILSPHVAGWTVESKEYLSRAIVEKIKARFA